MPDTQHPTPDTLVVMTFNLAAGLADPMRVAASVRAAGADVVGFQEVSAAQAATLPELLADVLPFAAMHGLGIPGKGVLSRFPLRDAGLLHLVPGRPDLRATLALPGGVVTALVVHPEPVRFGRERVARNARTAAHAEALAAQARVAAATGPVLVLGDLNRAPWQSEPRLFATAGLRDGWRAAGRCLGFTLPTRWAAGGHRGHWVGNVGLPPLVRVDYVWHSDDFVAEAAWLGEAAGSDHRPVVVRLRWRDGFPRDGRGTPGG
jgi:endonuclease/exonuclease/phosphatase (EEP) superfamily protein YafD